jgi:SAM-dependent methyltransferase
MKYNNTLLKGICCPFCQASEGSSLYTVTASEAATHFVLPWHNLEKYQQLEKHIRNLWNQTSCQVVCCVSCQGVFSLPFVAGDKKFYDLAYERTEYPEEKWEFTKAVEWLSREFKASKISEVKVLEIGAGKGSFLNKVIEIGVFPGNISAIEYSDWGREQLKSLNLNEVLHESIPSNKLLSKWQDKFDFVFMFQVLEHLDELDSKLKFLYSCLRPQGQIIFAVPNPQAIYFNELNGALLDMPPNHISRFSEASIQKLAIRNLLDVKLFEVEPLDKLGAYREFCYYRYLRGIQARHTVASLIARLPSKLKIRRLFEKLYRTISLLVNARFLGKIKEGSSQLVVIQKL